eukprot:Gregarina_sp_Poly_1__4445@NODE_2396_length_2186_cov_150_512034_g1525_i0_p1_GENE_NODE_2396_length_2186_cov_150_512034_g1525_i0NODE_2396_length_2186_cov_150_512034_g1525_i0_p1_ORF_typecomplete_len401_score37_32TMEM52/PF14979_6/0_11_NODE_2396_length_2186_cov_150_512034_g1525_i08282030
MLGKEPANKRSSLWWVSTAIIIGGILLLCGGIIGFKLNHFPHVANSVAENVFPRIGSQRSVFRNNGGVALIFLIVRNLSAPNIWNRWLLDAYDWVAEQAQLEDGLSFGEVLRTYVHHCPVFESGKVLEFLPEVLRHSLLSEPDFCLPSNVNGCLTQVYSIVSEDFPTAAYIIVTPESAIPLKPFSFLHNAVREDSVHLRLTLTSDHPNGTVRGPPWGGLPMSVASALSADSTWTHQWSNTRCKPNDCFQWKAMENIFDGKLGGIMPKIGTPGGDYPGVPHWFVDCRNFLPWCRSFGGLRDEDGDWVFTNLTWNFLRFWLEDPGAWLLHGIQDRTQLETGMPVHESLAVHWRSKHTDILLKEHPNASDILYLPPRHLSRSKVYNLWKRTKVYGLKQSLRQT